jgi:hypothetical protein
MKTLRKVILCFIIICTLKQFTLQKISKERSKGYSQIEKYSFLLLKKEKGKKRLDVLKAFESSRLNAICLFLNKLGPVQWKR